ncbi:MAG: MCE family protein [Deltaproteobacteria bacterium]|nr:MCE family protein [Deltaproteobacteria bacterium]
MAFDKRRNLDILLGAFVASGIVVLALFIFLIGRESQIFDRSAYINTYFKNVVGLSVGADVMLAGVLVGHVDKVGFPILEDQYPISQGKIKVVLRIPEDKLNWIRTNSIARIDGKGLLGDKIINISLGTSDALALKNGGLLASLESLDFNEALVKAQDVLSDITSAVKTAREFIERFVAEGGDVALVNTVKSVQNIAKEIESGSGLTHQLIYNKKSGQDFESALANLNIIITNTKEGQGTIGRLLIDPSIYDDLKGILGEVKRNRILKTLVRYSLSQREKLSAAESK